jgi:hypothetical protein
MKNVRGKRLDSSLRSECIAPQYALFLSMRCSLSEAKGLYLGQENVQDSKEILTGHPGQATPSRCPGVSPGCTRSLPGGHLRATPSPGVPASRRFAGMQAILPGAQVSLRSECIDPERSEGPLLGREHSRISSEILTGTLACLLRMHCSSEGVVP